MKSSLKLVHLEMLYPSTQTLGKTKVTKASFDNPNSSEIIFDVDYFGIKRSKYNRIAGQFSNIRVENGQLKI